MWCRRMCEREVLTTLGLLQISLSMLSVFVEREGREREERERREREKTERGEREREAGRGG